MADKIKKRIKLRVAGNDFTLLSSEDEAYSRALAARVDREIKTICRTAVTSVTGATILSALNYCDAMQKAEDEAADLKKQLSAYLEEIVELKAAIADKEREKEHLRDEIDLLRAKLHVAMTTNEELRQGGSISPAGQKKHFTLMEFDDMPKSAVPAEKSAEEVMPDKRDRRGKKKGYE